MKHLTDLTALELGRAIRRGDCTAVEAVSAALGVIRARNGRLNAYLAVLEEEALARARQVQRQIEGGALTGPLAGVPFAVKDNLCTKGVPTTCASRMLAGYCPPDSAAAVERLEAAGGILLGKLNMDEFAMGSFSETSAFGPVRNPWEESRSAGGSSGGSGAAVAAGMCWYALGTDTGGSIRQPAAWCGVTGLKPSYGRVSRYGLVAYASSLDQIGPMARSAADCAAVLAVMEGRDERDATSKSWQEEDISISRVGLLGGENWAGVLPALCGLGISSGPWSIPHWEALTAAYYTIAAAEAGSNLARYDGLRLGLSRPGGGADRRMARSRREGFGPVVRERILLGTLLLTEGYRETYYEKALALRQSLRDSLDRLFETYDLLLLPVSAGGALKLGEAPPSEEATGEPYTVPANLAGLPAISIPWGRDENGMPLGLQILGPRGCDRRVLALAQMLEGKGGEMLWNGT